MKKMHAAALPAERRVLARRGWVGEKAGLFEHPAWPVPVVHGVQTRDLGLPTELFRSLLVSLDARRVHLKALTVYWV
jgi:hypothetical protein